MTRDKWVWMPHAGHLIIGNACQFHLNTYVGKYIVSTVGEWWPDQSVRRIHAEIFDPKWHALNNHLKGDSYDYAYKKRFSYEEIGAGRKYETMVFKGGKVKSKFLCCPYSATNWSDIDGDAYNLPEIARAGHLKMCAKWARK